MTVKVPAWPTVKVVPAALVIVHACAVLTVRVKAWVSGPIPFVAVIVNGYVPAVVGVPASVPVPSTLSVNVTPDGSPVCRVRRRGQCAVGHAGRRDGKGPGQAGVKGGGGGLVIWHTWLTVRVKLWVL